MRRPVALFALVAATLAGCADDDEPGRTVTTEAGRPIAVVGDEYTFDPETVVVTTATSGPVEVTVELRNEGVLAHNLRLERGGRELGGTTTFQGGQARSATVRLGPGEYRMVCTVGNHEQLGMVGRIRVE